MLHLLVKTTVPHTIQVKYLEVPTYFYRKPLETTKIKPACWSVKRTLVHFTSSICSYTPNIFQQPELQDYQKKLDFSMPTLQMKTPVTKATKGNNEMKWRATFQQLYHSSLQSQELHSWLVFILLLYLLKQRSFQHHLLSL